MNKTGLRLKRMAVTAWKKEHPDKDTGPRTVDNGLPQRLGTWVEEINGKTFVGVQYFPPRSAPDETVFYEIVTAPKVVKAKQAIKVTRPPPKLVAEARRRDEQDRNFAAAVYDEETFLAWYGDRWNEGFDQDDGIGGNEK